MRNLATGPSGRRRAAKTVTLLSAGALVIGAAACSSSNGTGSATTGSGASEVSNGVATACDRAKAASQPVSFKAPGGAVDGTALKGKSIWIIPITNTGTVVQFTSQMESAAALLGAKVTTVDAKGSIPTAITGLNQAISGGANVIVNVAVDPTLVQRQQVEAQSKGIKVIDVVNSQPDTPPPTGVDGRVSWDYVQGGKWRMDKAICDTGGKLKLGFISSNDIPVGKLQEQGLTDEMNELCSSGCKMYQTNVNSAQWATGLAQAATNLIQRNSDINYLMPSFGAMVSTVLPTLKRVDPTDKIQVSSFDNEPELLNDLKAGTIKADLGTSFASLAWPTIDQALRLLNNQKAVVEVGPLRMVTTELAKQLNLSSSGDPVAQQKLIFGDLATGDGYKKLWGLTP